MAGTCVPPMRQIAHGNVPSALGAGLPAAEVAAWRDGVLAALDCALTPLARRARRRRLCPPRPWRPASGQSLPLAGPAGAVRRAGVRRGAGHHRPRLRPRLPAHGPGPAGGPRRRQPGAEPLCGAHRRCGAGGGAAGLPVDARHGARACRGAHAATPRHGAAYLARPRWTICGRPPPVVVAIGGLPGSGKSTLARALAPELGARPGRAGPAQRRNPQAPARRRAGAAPAAVAPTATAASQAVFADTRATASALPPPAAMRGRRRHVHRPRASAAQWRTRPRGRRAVRRRSGWTRRWPCWRRGIAARGGRCLRRDGRRAARAPPAPTPAPATGMRDRRARRRRSAGPGANKRCNAILGRASQRRPDLHRKRDNAREEDRPWPSASCCCR